MKNKRSLIMVFDAMKKPFLIMRLTIFFTIFCVFNSFAGIEGQTVSLDMRGAELRKVLVKIEKQGVYRFLFNTRLEELKQRVDVSFTNLDIDMVLSRLFTGTGLSFKKLDNNLIAIRLGADDETDVTVSGLAASSRPS